MEADWSVEVGGEAMVIEGHWAGFIDLRQAPDKIKDLEEVRRFPPLGWALKQLNVLGGGLWTSKCDVWTLIANHTDPDEMGAKPEDMRAGKACYLDVLLREKFSFSSFERQERWARKLTNRLRAIELPKARIDFVIRRAVTKSHSGYGMTAYCGACGPTDEDAKVSLEQALHALIPLLCEGL